ncbi:MAG TPA: zf-HC2 domain-containing protein [Gammaproteobacteria bacterium]|nr:zf-HC2 domain-containing protein [Gammaproteobacteria bacterium]
MTEPEALGHSRAFDLLPWLVNGTLDATERDAVEQHVRTCIVCRRELKEQRHLKAAVGKQPTIHVSAHAGLADLDRRLDATPPVSGTREWGGWYSALQPFAYATAAGIALLAFLLWLTPLPEIDADQYGTLATETAETAKLIDVVFAQQTTAAEMAALLAEVDGEIVAGPSAVGRYSVRIASGRASDAQLLGIVDRLATDSRVRFVGPSLAELPP